MSGWAKGGLAQALEEVGGQRGATPLVVNAAYPSHRDAFTGELTGKRVGDEFYRAHGDVLQADFNAARKGKARLHDPDIVRFMPPTEVRRSLLSRSCGATERQEAPVGR